MRRNFRKLHHPKVQENLLRCHIINFSRQCVGYPDILAYFIFDCASVMLVFIRLDPAGVSSGTDKGVRHPWRVPERHNLRCQVYIRRHPEISMFHFWGVCWTGSFKRSHGHFGVYNVSLTPPTGAVAPVTGVAGTDDSLFSSKTHPFGVLGVSKWRNGVLRFFSV